MKVNHASGIVVTLLGVGVMYVASTLPFTDASTTLGPGMFPFVLGVLLLLLGIAIFSSASLSTAPEQDVRAIFAWKVVRRPAAAVGLLALSVSLLEVAGFAVSMMLLLIGFLRAFSSYSWTIIVTISIVTTVVFYGLFGLILNVPIALFPNF